MPIAMLKLIIYLPSKICTKAPASLNIGIFLEVSVLWRRVEIFSCLGAHRHSIHSIIEKNWMINFTLNFKHKNVHTRIFTLNRQLHHISKKNIAHFCSIPSNTSPYISDLVKMAQLPSRIVTLTFLHSWFCSVLLTKLHILNGVFRIIYPQFQPLLCQQNGSTLNLLLPSKYAPKSPP